MVSEDEIRAVAANARIDLADDEVAMLADDLDAILESFETLDAIDTDGVEPSFHPVPSEASTRKDEPEDCLSQGEALANTDNTENGYFKGPKAV